MSPEALRRSLLRMLIERVLPLASRTEAVPLILMEPLHLLRSQHEKTLHHGTALLEKPRHHSRLYLNRWKDSGVESVRYPCLAAVIEGEIDWRIGITQSQAKQNSALSDCDYMIVPVPQDTLFFTPPGIARSDGSGFHWDRAAPKREAAIIFYLLILPSGFMCHFCRSTAREHMTHQQIFLVSPTLHSLAKMLEEELLHNQSEEITIRGLLQSILGYAKRALEEEIIVQPNKNNSALFVESDNHDISKNALARAQDFIEMNLKEKLTPAIIAKQAYISARQLDRYFLRDTGMNIMEYALRHRMETAKGLLRDTDLPVKQIGLLVGYQNPSSFAQIFKRHVGESPGSFRGR